MAEIPVYGLKFCDTHLGPSHCVCSTPEALRQYVEFMSQKDPDFVDLVCGAFKYLLEESRFSIDWEDEGRVRYEAVANRINHEKTQEIEFDLN